MEDRFVTFQSFTTEIEAEIVRGRLLSEGIEALIVKDDCGGMYPQLRLTQGVILKVLASELERAARIIGPPPSSQQPTTPASGAGDMSGILAVNAWIVGLIGLGLMFVGLEDTKWFYIGLMVMVLGLALKFLSRLKS